MKKSGNTLAYETENRFGFYIFIFRLGGVDILPQRSWKLYKIYGPLVTLCAYGTYIAVAADMLLTDDLKHIMENVRAFVGMTSAYWMQTYIR
jgi:hypothetical protein